MLILLLFCRKLCQEGSKVSSSEVKPQHTNQSLLVFHKAQFWARRFGFSTVTQWSVLDLNIGGQIGNFIH